MSKVLILTAGYGEGHNAAARGLHAAFSALGADAQVIDLFELTGGTFYQRSRKGYINLINTAPKVWAAIYRILDVFPLVTMSLPFLGSMIRLLRRMIEEERPHAVISVYPVYSYLIEQLYPQGRPFAFHTVITDSITINSVWHRAPSDTLIIPNEDSVPILREAGLPPERIHTLGFPVAPRFAHDRPVREGLETPRILYMINAGRDRAAGIVRRLLAITPLHLTVTVGRDEVLRAELESIAFEMGRPLEIHGWTNQMPELLMTHHLLIGKAGGATVQETIAACTPMLLTQIVPGQEEGNAKLLLQNQCGALCETAEELGATVERLFARGGARWREWEANIRRLSKPDAAEQIAGFVLNYPHS